MRFSAARLLGSGGEPNEHIQRLTRHLPTIASTLLVVLIAYVLADLTWRVIPLDHGTPGTGESAAPQTPTGTGEALDIEALVAAQPFGEPDPADDADGDDEDVDLEALDAPETQLELELKGVIATGVSEQARAIISTDDDGDKDYAVGDEIASGAELRAVHADRVILERRGELETLHLPYMEENGLEFTTGPDENGETQDVDDEVEVPDEVAGLRDDIRENPQKITEIIRPAPYEEDGEMIGFRVFPGQMRDEFQALGLRPGDVITAVNGQALDSPGAAMQLLDELEDATSVQLTILRDDAETSIEISLSR